MLILNIKDNYTKPAKKRKYNIILIKFLIIVISYIVFIFRIKTKKPRTDRGFSGLLFFVITYTMMPATALESRATRPSSSPP